MVAHRNRCFRFTRAKVATFVNEEAYQTLKTVVFFLMMFFLKEQIKALKAPTDSEYEINPFLNNKFETLTTERACIRQF